MTEDELKDLDREVKKLKRIASEWASQLHDLVEERLPRPTRRSTRSRNRPTTPARPGPTPTPASPRRRKAADMEPITGLTRGGAAWTPTFVKLDQKTCIGCGRCYKVCPRDVFDLVERDDDDSTTTRTTPW
jgi:ferredoxin